MLGQLYDQILPASHRLFDDTTPVETTTQRKEEAGAKASRRQLFRLRILIGRRSNDFVCLGGLRADQFEVATNCLAVAERDGFGIQN